MIRSPEDAHAAMELMLSDSAVRDSVDWDWQTQGYGQTVFQLVQASSRIQLIMILYHQMSWNLFISRYKAIILRVSLDLTE
jgi:hypothetical protein